MSTSSPDDSHITHEVILPGYRGLCMELGQVVLEQEKIHRQREKLDADGQATYLRIGQLKTRLLEIDAAVPIAKEVEAAARKDAEAALEENVKPDHLETPQAAMHRLLEQEKTHRRHGKKGAA